MAKRETEEKELKTKKKTKEKELTKKNKKNGSDKKKKEKKLPKESYMEGVSEELKKVKWPSKKEVIKYTIATVIFVLVLVAFFLLLDLGMSVIKEAFN